MPKPLKVSNIFPGDPRYTASEPTAPLDLVLGRALAADLASNKQTAAAALLRHMIDELEDLRRRLDQVEAAERRAIEACFLQGGKSNG